MDAMCSHKTLGSQLDAPSVSTRDSVLYMTGALAAQYAPNLTKPLHELLGTTFEEEGCATVMVTDRRVKEALKIRLLTHTMKE